MEIKSIYATKKIEKKSMELKAKEVAKTVFDFHFESKLFEQFNVKEILEILSNKVDTLNKKFKNKPYAKLVAKRLSWLIEDYAEEHHLCTNCYHELVYKTVIKQTYHEPESGIMVCDECGYEEAM